MLDSRTLLNNALGTQSGPYVVLTRAEVLHLDAELSLLDQARRFLTEAAHLLVCAPQDADSPATAQPVAALPVAALSVAAPAQSPNGHAAPNPPPPPPKTAATPAEANAGEADPNGPRLTTREIAEAFSALDKSQRLFSDYAKPLQTELLVRLGAEMIESLGEMPSADQWDATRPHWAPSAKRMCQSWKQPWIDWRAQFDAFAGS